MLTSPLRAGAEAKYRRRDLERMITEVSGVRAGSRSNSFEMSTTGTQEVSVPVHQAARLLLDSRCRLAAHLDARHWCGCLPWHGLEIRLHDVQSAKDNRAYDSRDNEKPEKAWHVAKLLLARYVPNSR